MNKNLREVQSEEKMNHLLVLTEKLISKHGFDGFTFDDLTNESIYSRATIYTTLKNKEILFARLAIKALEAWKKLTSRAIKYNGSAREKLIAIYVAQAITLNMFPGGFRTIFYVNSPYFNDVINHDMSSLGVKSELKELNQFFITSIEGLMNEAIEHKQLKVSDTFDTKEMANNFWSSTYGFISLNINNADNLMSLIKQSESFISFIADSIEWQPLSTKHDYQKLIKHIIADLFPIEHAQIKGVNINFKFNKS